MRKFELLTVAQMHAADSAAIEAGTPGIQLMENAGQAIAFEIHKRWQPCPVTVLCGPGNNGGDGFVVARLLRVAGWQVRLALLAPVDRLRGDAAIAANMWRGEIEAVSTELINDAELVVDALFGAGLGRDLEGVALEVVDAINSSGVPCVAVDVPSGVHGDSGRILGAAPRARLTVTFCRRKPGHLLLPGRTFSGEVVCADIGISDLAVNSENIDLYENGPWAWLRDYPWPSPDGHKYDRGHALVIGGGASVSGAARLAARGALRIGAGLVTVAAPLSALAVYGAQLTAVMLTPLETLDSQLQDKHKNAIMIGPGCGVGVETADRVLAILMSKRACVLDADALTSFENNPNQLFDKIHSETVLTPHEGEFSRLFGLSNKKNGTYGKVERARAAARHSGAVIVYKGSDTVIASPDGRAAINTNAPPDLATAGAGDVLAGLILGLLAQRMNAFDAACAGTWLHGAAASRFGPGLIAEDLAEALPAELVSLRRQTEKGAGGS